ncbi:MAG: hypothetical protein HKO57_01030, partial [Akkermansiaceae bacterium]|nr:hypothetical protein [Akkermansiaceae bacterium]
MKTKPTRTRGTTLLAVLGLALGVHAQTLIPATSMTAEARHNYASREPGRVLNGVSNGGGFTADGSITTAALPADYRLDSTVGGTGTFGQVTNWTGNSATAQWFRVDLGADYSLDSMAFFNLCVNAAGAASTLNRGVLQADIYYRSAAAGPGGNSNGDGVDFDATGWTLLGTAGTQMFTKVPAPGDTSIAPDVVSFGGVTARYVAFDINSAHSGSNVGIAELLFFESSGVPDPILNVAPGSPDPDYDFGNVFGGAPAPTRTVTLVNDSVGGSATINIDSVTITDDGGGVFGGLTVTYDAGNTGTPPLLENGDTVSIEIAASPVGSGSATGNLEILTTSAGGTVTADFNDKNFPLSAEVIPAGEKLNPNPFMESGLADWDNVSGDGEAVPVSPGLAGGSSGMARVRGIGDASSTGPGDLEHPTSHMQSTGVPDGAPNWQLSAFFTPIDASTFGGYSEEATGATAADGAFSDRTFQLVVLSADTGRPFPGFDDAQAAGTLINIAYMPDGVQDNLGVPDFYVFNGDIAGTAFGGTWIPTGIGAIEGSIDNDGDLSTANGVGDGLLDPSVDPNDVVNAYRILVTGTGFGSPGASYDITVTKVSGPDTFVSGTATGLKAFQGVSGDSGTPAGYSFITSDVSSDLDTGSNQGDSGVPGLATPFWVDDVCFFNVAGPDPSLTVANNPGRIAVCSPDTTGTTSFTIRNDGTSNNLEIDSISFSGATGFSVNSPGIPFSVAAGASEEITIEWDSAAAGESLETATVTVSDSTNGLSSD